MRLCAPPCAIPLTFVLLASCAGPAVDASAIARNDEAAPSPARTFMSQSIDASLGADTDSDINAELVESDDAGIGIDGSIPCEVELILESRCRPCHNATLLAPPSALASVGDFLTVSATSPPRLVRDVARDRVAARDERRMPPLHGMPLTSEELTTLLDWLGQDALRAEDACPIPDSEE